MPGTPAAPGSPLSRKSARAAATRSMRCADSGTFSPDPVDGPNESQRVHGDRDGRHSQVPPPVRSWDTGRGWDGAQSGPRHTVTERAAANRLTTEGAR
ncbi:hypothetical protein GCM10022263_38830 [Nocardioides daeguensis]|uniref:Uncharacterized protein n=1 Tax=Nocardioides daeguensis TaxID=908359 RepID=A0ABP6W812_9ACTN